MKTADHLKIKGLCEVPEGEEDEMDDNGESITDVSVLGNNILQDKSQKQRFFSKIKSGKLIPQMKRKISQDTNMSKKYCTKETSKINEQNVQQIQTTTINPNDILDTNNHPQVCSFVNV